MPMPKGPPKANEAPKIEATALTIDLAAKTLDIPTKPAIAA